MYRTASFEHDGSELVYDVYGSGERLLVYMHGLLLDSDMNRGIARGPGEQRQPRRVAGPAGPRPQ